VLCAWTMCRWNADAVEFLGQRNVNVILVESGCRLYLSLGREILSGDDRAEDEAVDRLALG
jgi:hypothetical protein